MWFLPHQPADLGLAHDVFLGVHALAFCPPSSLEHNPAGEGMSASPSPRQGGLAPVASG